MLVAVNQLLRSTLKSTGKLAPSGFKHGAVEFLWLLKISFCWPSFVHDWTWCEISSLSIAYTFSVSPSFLLPQCPLLPSPPSRPGHFAWRRVPQPAEHSGPEPGPWGRVICPGLLFLSHTTSWNKWPQQIHLLIAACLFAFELSVYRGQGFILPNKIKDSIIYPAWQGIKAQRCGSGSCDITSPCPVSKAGNNLALFLLLWT